MRAAVFLLHGLFDFNVKTNNLGYLWESLPQDLPQKLWLFNGDHVDPHVPTVEDAQAGNHVMPHPFQAQFIEATHRWYLQFLKGVEAGALATPQFAVQRADGAFADGGSFPAATRDVALHLTPDRTLIEGAAAEGTVVYRDAPTGSAPTSVVVTTEPFTEDTRLSGQFGFDLDISIEGVDTSSAVTILSVPPDVEPTVRSTDTMDGTNTAPLRLGHAWLRAFYRGSVPLRGVSTPARGAFMNRNEHTEVQFGSLYTDVVVPAGNRLAFRISNSEGGTVAANTGGTVSLHTGLEGSRILLPVADPPAPPAPVPSATPTPLPSAPPSPPAPPAPATIERVSADDRIGTAVEVSEITRDQADTVVLARADEYADALTGAPLAAQLGAPLLLTGSDRLDARTADEIDRLGADEAVLLGGTDALSSSVEDELARTGLSTRRAAGPNRFATAAAIADQLPPSQEFFLAEGANADPQRGWPDALSASALAAGLVRPVLLATRDDLPPETADALSDEGSVTIVGGPDALSEDLAAEVDEVAGTVRRLAGADRYETSVRLADEGLGRGLDPAVTWVATGTDWPDGLAAAAAAGAGRGVMVLVEGNDAEESAPTLAWISDHRDAIRTLRLVGGDNAITAETEDQLHAALTG